MTIFTLPANVVSSITAYIGDIFIDVGMFIYLGIGVPIGFYFIKKIIDLFKR